MNGATAPIALSSTAAPARETLLWQGTPSRWNYLAASFWGTLLLPLGLGLFILLGAYLRRRRLRYLVTSDRLVARYGLLIVSSRSLRICDVRSINIYRRGVSGLFGLGTIEFSSAAHDAASLYFHGILEAEAVADTVRALQCGGSPSPLPGSHETESAAAAALHFAGLALVPILCVFLFGLQLRDKIQALAPGVKAATATTDNAPEGYPGSSTTVLPTLAPSQPPVERTGASAGPEGSVAAAPSRGLSPAAFARAEAASRSRAIRRFPALGIAGSHLNTAFVTRYEQLAREHSERLQNPNWPEQLAADCAAKIPARYQ